MTKSLSLIAAALLLSACGNGPNNAEKPNIPSSGVIKFSKGGKAFAVNGEVVTQQLLDQYAKRRGFDLNDPGQQKQAVDELSNLVALAQASHKLGLDESAEAEIERLNALSGMAIAQQLESTPITDDELRARYDQQVTASGDKEYRVEHMLFRTAEAASAAHAALLAGTAFADVAASNADSADFVATPDWNFVQLTQLPPPIADALRPLSAGETAAAPVQTDFGHHVLRVAETRPFTPQEFNVVKQGIREQLTQERRAAYVESIKSSTVID